MGSRKSITSGSMSTVHFQLLSRLLERICTPNAVLFRGSHEAGVTGRAALSAEGEGIKLHMQNMDRQGIGKKAKSGKTGKGNGGASEPHVDKDEWNARVKACTLVGAFHSSLSTRGSEASPLPLPIVPDLAF